MTSNAPKRLLGAAFTVLSLAAGVARAQGNLENPAPDGSESGIGLISGWHCGASRIEVGFDGGPLKKAAYGTSRGDTASVCGDTDNGFGLLYNYNLLGPGTHTARAYADGVLFATRTFTVTTLGGEFIPGLSKTALVPNFPGPGQGAVVTWQESKQNFVIERLTTVPAPGFDPTGHWTEPSDSTVLLDIQKDDAGHLSIGWLDAEDLSWLPLEGDLDGQSARVSIGVLGKTMAFDIHFASSDSATMTIVECTFPIDECAGAVGITFQINRCSTVGLNCL
ncbi:MAG: hypothetical protein IT469_09870 [Pseudomonadales bacterium]|nr:hypothetical protein [Pseudomonadales bacterium]